MQDLINTLLALPVNQQIEEVLSLLETVGKTEEHGHLVDLASEAAADGDYEDAKQFLRHVIFRVTS